MRHAPWHTAASRRRGAQGDQLAVLHLVGFTAGSESADPEDVDHLLSAYAAMARAQIEFHGGVVEKFIGDAVVGVFGVPAAHEDDPERACVPAFGSLRAPSSWRPSAGRRCGCA